MERRKINWMGFAFVDKAKVPERKRIVINFPPDQQENAYQGKYYKQMA
jgi:hypothetical protein